MHIGAVRTDRYFTQHYRIELDLFSLSPHISLSFVQSSVLNCCNEGNYSSIEYPIPHYMQFATIVIWRAFFFFLPVHNPYSSISRPYSVLLVQHIKLDRISFQIANWIFLVHCHLLPFIHNKIIHHARSISFDSFFYFFFIEFDALLTWNRFVANDSNYDGRILCDEKWSCVYSSGKGRKACGEQYANAMQSLKLTHCLILKLT